VIERPFFSSQANDYQEELTEKMTKGIKHADVGPICTSAEFHAETAHFLDSGMSNPGSPSEMDLFYRTDEHKWYFYNGTVWTAMI
jgi:hypothetical protein